MGDQILNPIADPFLTFAEQERKKGKAMFSPWTTKDSQLLSLAKQYFSDIPLTEVKKLKKPAVTPIKIVILNNKIFPVLAEQKEYFIAVGGPSAAMVAFQQAKNGRPVLYVNNNACITQKNCRPIWAGAANHGEPDVLTQGPTYMSGYHPLKLFVQEWKRCLYPSRFDAQVLS